MMNERKELEERIQARMKEWESELHRLKAESNASARERRAELEARLEEAKSTFHEMKETVSEEAAARMNRLLGKN